MYLIMVVMLIVGAGLMQQNIFIGSAVMIAAILLGDKLHQMTGGDDWLMSIIFLVGISAVPLFIVWHLLIR